MTQEITVGLKRFNTGRFYDQLTLQIASSRTGIRCALPWKPIWLLAIMPRQSTEMGGYSRKDRFSLHTGLQVQARKPSASDF